MIPIQNIYYMLAYSFQPLREEGYKKVATEQFHNVADLCAAILIKGVSQQLKRGLGREYISETETLSGIRGKIDITESIKTQAMLRKQMVCTYDEFSVNTYMNRIIKTTMVKLLHTDIDKGRKKAIKKLLVFFDGVEELEVHSINWKQQYTRNNKTYQMLVSICYLVLKGLLQTQSDGSTKMMDFTVEQKHHLYEKFILGYYRTEHPEIKANAPQVPWQVDDGIKTMLPIMQTDITLEHKEKILIIDAKFYGHTTQVQYDKHTLHSGNLYQIFTYVKNKEYELREKEHKVSGMLLYAKTDEEIYPDNVYQMSGNQITVRTLDLNLPFAEIARQLDEIVETHFDLQEDTRMNKQEKRRILQSILDERRANSFYEALENMGDLKANYSDYMTTGPISCDEELKRVPDADYELCTALLTMLLREDHFSNGSFEKRVRAGEVKPLLERMIDLLAV